MLYVGIIALLDRGFESPQGVRNSYNAILLFETNVVCIVIVNLRGNEPVFSKYLIRYVYMSHFTQNKIKD
jgi:hypothetical protein